MGRRSAQAFVFGLFAIVWVGGLTAVCVAQIPAPAPRTVAAGPFEPSHPCYAEKVAHYGLEHPEEFECVIRGGGGLVSADDPSPHFLCDANGKEYPYRSSGLRRYYANCNTRPGAHLTVKARELFANYVQCNVSSNTMGLEVGIGKGNFEMGMSTQPALCRESFMYKATKAGDLPRGASEQWACPVNVDPDLNTAQGQGMVLRGCQAQILSDTRAIYHNPSLNYCAPNRDWPSYDQELLKPLRIGPYANRPITSKTNFCAIKDDD